MSSSNNNNNADNQQQLQLVPESILKKKHDMDEMKAKRAAQAITNPRGNRKIFSKSKSKAYKFNKPETYIANARTRKNHDLRYKRVLKKGMQKRASKKKVMVTKKEEIVDDDNNDNESSDAKKTVTRTYQTNSIGANMVFVIRIRDQVGCPNSVKRALSRLRLRNVNEGVFVRYNESNKKMLHLCEPWIIYGMPSKGIVEDLIKRRGHGKGNGGADGDDDDDDKNKRIPISDNTIIENALGDSTGIICVEDLVYELCNCTENFHKATSFLWPFRLSALKSKFQKDQLNDTKGNAKNKDEYGDQGELINDYIKQML